MARITFEGYFDDMGRLTFAGYFEYTTRNSRMRT